MARPLWFALGWVCVALGGIGVVVPGLPTTGFFVLAASCFAKSSPRFERWVLRLPGVGPMVRDYRAGLGMPRMAKVWAIGMIAVVSLVSAVFAVDNRVVGAVILAVAAVGVWYVGWRIPTRERVVEARVARDAPG
jgi:uncharacterized membrane protein YbaN (DUF454 family)